MAEQGEASSDSAVLCTVLCLPCIICKWIYKRLCGQSLTLMLWWLGFCCMILGMGLSSFLFSPKIDSARCFAKMARHLSGWAWCKFCLLFFKTPLAPNTLWSPPSLSLLLYHVLRHRLNGATLALALFEIFQQGLCKFPCNPTCQRQYSMCSFFLTKLGGFVASAILPW